MIASNSTKRGQAVPEPPEGGKSRGEVVSAARLLGALTLLSRLSGLARDMVMSAIFGASAGADAFFIAFRIPNLFRRVVAEGATSAAFVPVFTAEKVRGGNERAVEAAAAVGGAAALVLAVLTLVGMLLSGPIVELFAPGFAGDPEKLALTIRLTRLLFPYLFFVGAAAWAMGLLHTFRSFAVPAYGPVLLNLSIIACATLLASAMVPPVMALVVGVSIGGILQFAVQVPSLVRLGVRGRNLFRFSDPAIPRVGRLVGAAVFGGAVYQVNILVATVFASLLPAGSVSWLWYGDRVFEFPLGIVAVAIGTAALPTMSAQVKEGRFDAFVDSIGHALRLTWTLCLPAAAGLWLLAPEVVALLFERGQFDAADSLMTAWALRCYVWGILGVASVRVLASAFYAMEKPRVPVYTAIVAMVVNVVFDLALMGPPEPGIVWWGGALVERATSVLAIVDMRHAGLALSTGIAATVNAVLLAVLLQREIGSLHLREMLPGLARQVLATIAMVVAIVGTAGLFAEMPDTVALFALLAIGGGVYLGCALLLGNEEVRELLGVG